ncbi:MAG: protoporphyrinogen oxidase HemJ [Leadbetterella sp.]
MNLYQFFKALHIIGFVSWFAGLFYLVRMFVYHAEVVDKPTHLQDDWYAQFSLMQRRVYTIIANPAMMITWFCGLGMLIINPYILEGHWIKIKLGLVLGLTIYHLYCKSIMKKQEQRLDKRSSESFRMLNELPTLFLVAIVILAVCKDLVSFLWLFLGVLAFAFLLFGFIKLYKKNREKNKN